MVSDQDHAETESSVTVIVPVYNEAPTVCAALDRLTDNGQPTVDQPPTASIKHLATAFTLVELLTIIGIISLLIALLLPAVVRVRQNAEKASCLARLRQVGMAAAAHVAEHRGYLPVAGWHYDEATTQPSGTGAPPVSSAPDLATPQGLHDSIEYRYSYYTDAGKKRPVPVTVALAHYMAVDLPLDSREALVAGLNSERLQVLFRCPAMSQKQVLSGVTQRDDADGWIAPPEFSSYVFNEAVLGMRSLADTGGNQPPIGNTVRIKHSSAVMLAADGNPRNQDTDNWLLVFDKSATDTL